jgi:hypothetical protein
MPVSNSEYESICSGGWRTSGRRLRIAVAVLALHLAPSAAIAGLPFQTDDPEPTETGHWEIYAPLIEAEGRGDGFDGAVGAEFNYGAAKDLQLTVGLPVDYSHDMYRWRSGVGDVELSAKYRFINDETSGLQVAAFPGLTLPTASNDMGAGRVTALLPVWVQKDWGKWSVFGGGGYAINPGVGNRNYWTGGIAVSRQFSDRFLLGAEYDRRGSNELGGHSSSSLGLGAIML